MGKWRLECPLGAKYEGECQLEGHHLECDIKIKKDVRPGCIEGDLPNNPGEGLKPYGWTEYEKSHPAVKRKMVKCVDKVEEKGSDVNPWAVCRSSIRCPPDH